MSRNKAKPRSKSEPSLGTNWIAHTYEMRKSPAWQALPDDARRALDRIELEHMAHGRAENGNLIITYSDFNKCGVRRNAIRTAIKTLEALGFIKIREADYRPKGSRIPPHRYTITFFGIRDGVSEKGWRAPTDEWRQIGRLEDAIAIVDRIRGVRKRAAPARGNVRGSTTVGTGVAVPPLVPVNAISCSTSVGTDTSTNGGTGETEFRSRRAS